MASRTCSQCGGSMPELAKFCGQCGSVSEPGPVTDRAPPPAASGPNPNRTMMEFAAPAPAVAGAPPGQPPPPRAATVSDTMPEAQRRAPVKNTMIGISAQDIFPHAPAPVPAPAPIPAAADVRDPRGDKKTMMGVAVPGIAPTHTAPTAPTPANARNRTMMGVAMPGIAPTHESEPPPPVAPPVARPPRAPVPHVDIVPAPPPLYDAEPAPAAPVVVRKKGGVPLAVVLALVAVLLIGGGVTIALVLMRGGPSLTARSRLDASGKDVLHLTCESCKDETVAELNGAKTTFQGGQADLPLLVPLKVGDNALAIRIDRPGMGRDETVNLTVPLPWRIRPDLTTLESARPSITVRVEAVPGTDVQIEGKPVTLDASGAGAYVYDVTAQTEGSSDTSTEISKQFSYVVTPKGAEAEKGTVSAKVAVVPLSIDGPSAHAVIAGTSFLVWGRGSTSSTISVNGKAVPIVPDPKEVERARATNGKPMWGRFEATVDATSDGDVPFDVRASAPSFAPRTVHRSIKKVKKLEDEAKALEAQSPPGYDAIMAEIATKTGQPIVVEGEALSASVSGHKTLVNVDDRRGCAKPPCVAFVVVSHEETIAKGDPIRAYGRVAKAYTLSDGKTQGPEVEADFILIGKPQR